jgi:hypothetical protein
LATSDLSYKLVFENLNEVNTIQVITTRLATLENHAIALKYKPGIQTMQEVSSVAIWNPVASLALTTSLLPVVPSQTSTPRIYTSSANPTSNGEPIIASIFSDFGMSITPQNQYIPDITYVHPGEYRSIDMYASYNFNKVDLTVYWKDSFGSLNPIYLQPGCGTHDKLLFRRKHFYV